MQCAHICLARSSRRAKIFQNRPTPRFQRFVTPPVHKCRKNFMRRRAWLDVLRKICRWVLARFLELRRASQSVPGRKDVDDFNGLQRHRGTSLARLVSVSDLAVWVFRSPTPSAARARSGSSPGRPTSLSGAVPAVICQKWPSFPPTRRLLSWLAMEIGSNTAQVRRGNPFPGLSRCFDTLLDCPGQDGPCLAPVRTKS